MDVQKLGAVAARTRNALVVVILIAIVLLASNFFLVVKLASQSNQVVLIPTTIRDGMVARGIVDKGYIEALALDAVYAMYNASPESLDHGRATIERLTAPDARARILAVYDETADDMKERDISTVFFPRVIEHNFDTFEVVVEGKLATYLETTQVATKDRRILLKFRPQAGSVRLVNIGSLSES